MLSGVAVAPAVERRFKFGPPRPGAVPVHRATSADQPLSSDQSAFAAPAAPVPVADSLASCCGTGRRSSASLDQVNRPQLGWIRREAEGGTRSADSLPDWRDAGARRP